VSRTNSSGPGALVRAIRLGAFAFACAVGTGCAATVAAEPAYFEADIGAAVIAPAVPVDIYTRPRVYYRGTYVYLVDGRWYYPTTRGYMVYHREPTELRRYRERIYADPRYRYRAPPARTYRPY
jgi:hypothetical protein